MRILRLTSENVKRLSAVEIAPDGNVIVIGGMNAAGKTSVLDSIEMALRGRTSIPSQPIRKGQDRASVKIDLGDLEVERIFTPSGNRLIVKERGGKPAGSPQAILDKLIGAVSFDPLEFSRMKPRDQATQLQQLMGLDFSLLEAERQKHFEDRTSVNRQKQTIEAQLAGAPLDPDAPAIEISVSSLVETLNRQMDRQRTNDDLRSQLAESEKSLAASKGDIEKQERAVQALRDQLAQAERLLSTLKDDRHEAEQGHADLAQQVANLIDPDVETTRQQINEAESKNTRCRANAKRRELERQLESLVEEAENLTTLIQSIDQDKERQAQKATFPIAGLGFDLEGVTYGGVTFSQISAAEKLRVSVAVGIALNPKLKVLLIRDGSLLDPVGLEMVAEMAKAADAQVWIERVSTGKECQVVIEDGHVKVAEPEPANA